MEMMHEATWAERRKYVGREATVSLALPSGRTITRSYRILAVTRFSADGPLMAEVGAVDLGVLGTAGVYQEVDSLDLVPTRTTYVVNGDHECSAEEV